MENKKGRYKGNRVEGEVFYPSSWVVYIRVNTFRHGKVADTLPSSCSKTSSHGAFRLRHWPLATAGVKNVRVSSLTPSCALRNNSTTKVVDKERNNRPRLNNNNNNNNKLWWWWWKWGELTSSRPTRNWANVCSYVRWLCISFHHIIILLSLPFYALIYLWYFSGH